MLHWGSHGLIKVLQGKRQKHIQNKQLIIIISNLSTRMCHAFIYDKIQMPTLVIDLHSDSSQCDNVKIVTITKLIPIHLENRSFKFFKC
jgi:hypothetical protein